MSVATVGDVREHPRVADGASKLLEDIFGRDKNPSRLVYGVASLPLGTLVEPEQDARDDSRVLLAMSLDEFFQVFAGSGDVLP